MAIDITKGIEPFDEATDFTRGNKDRQQFGKTANSQQFDQSSEFAAPKPTEAAPVVPPVVEAKKFTHKLGNGTTLEAASIEELAGLIEKSFQNPPPPPPQEFEDKPLYVPMEFKRKELTVQEKADILNLWKEDPQLATRKLQEAEFGVPIDTLIQNLSRAELRELHRRQEEAGVEFLGECESYNPTAANAKKITEYLKSKGKPITKQNLVLSFNQLVAAGDKTLLRKVDDPVLPDAAPADDPSLTDVPPPPVVVPSNQGRPEVAAKGEVDVAKFASLPLEKQKQFFADLRRR